MAAPLTSTCVPFTSMVSPGRPMIALDEVALGVLGILEDDDVAAPTGRTGSSVRSTPVAAGANTNLLTSR